MRLPVRGLSVTGCEGGATIDVHDAVTGPTGPAGARPPDAAGLVRVSVTSAARRVDLVLPGTVPVAELLPELVRSVGRLDAGTAVGGYRVITAGGTPLVASLALTPQGVRDGAVLVLVAAADDPEPVVYDDVAEATSDAVERDLPPWRPAAARRTTLAASAGALAVGVVALLRVDDRSSAGIAAAVLAALLLLGGVLISRVRRRTEPAVTACWLAVTYAATAAHLLVATIDGGGGVEPGLRAVVVGGSAAVVGLLAVLALGAGRVLVGPAVVVGVVHAAAGLWSLHGVASDSADGPPQRAAVAVLVLLTVAVLTGSVLPWLALAPTTNGAEAAYTTAPGIARPVDAAQVTADVRLAQQVLVAVTVTLGLLLVLAAPAAVGLGLGATLLVVDASAVVVLRTRHYRTRPEVLGGLAAGVAGLLAVALVVVLRADGGQLAVATVAVLAGMALLGLALGPEVGSGSTALLRGRLGDVAETVTLLALLPLLVWATGLLGLVGAGTGRL